jgi:hypothetical protein
MEPSEFRTNHKEHSIKRVGIFELRKEGGVQTERESDLGGLVKVGL